MFFSTVSPPGEDFPERLPLGGELTTRLIKTVEGRRLWNRCGKDRTSEE